jgi:hypothetical protein
MNCEELILSVVVILLLMFLIAFMCSRVSQRDYFADAPSPAPEQAPALGKRQPRLEWGGVPVQMNNVMDHGNTGMNRGMLPVTNSRTAIQRLVAETVTPPWSDEGYGTEEAFNPGGDSYVKQLLKKKKGERKNFKSHGAYKNATGVRYMKMESL